MDSSAGEPAGTESVGIKEAAAMLGVSTSLVRKMCRIGVLPYYRRGVTQKSPFGILRAAVAAYKVGTCPWAAVGQTKPEGPARAS